MSYGKAYLELPFTDNNQLSFFTKKWAGLICGKSY